MISDTSRNCEWDSLGEVAGSAWQLLTSVKTLSLAEWSDSSCDFSSATCTRIEKVSSFASLKSAAEVASSCFFIFVVKYGTCLAEASSFACIVVALCFVRWSMFINIDLIPKQEVFEGVAQSQNRVATNIMII